MSMLNIYGHSYSVLVEGVPVRSFSKADALADAEYYKELGYTDVRIQRNKPINKRPSYRKEAERPSECIVTRF